MNSSTQGFYFIFFWCLFAARAFLQVLVLLQMWTWFVAPLGVVTLGFWQGFGLLLIVGLVRLTYQQIDASVDTTPDFKKECFLQGVRIVAVVSYYGFGSVFQWLAS